MKKGISYLFLAAVAFLTIASTPLMAQAACNHDLQFNEAYEETCLEDGMEAYYECNICHEIFADANAEQPLKREEMVIPAYGHYYEPEHLKVVQKKATLKNDGCVGFPCVECGIIGETNVVPKVEQIKLSFSSRTYNGKTQKPTLKITTRKGILYDFETGGEEDGRYQAVFPTSSKNVGRYTVKISFMYTYSGNVEMTYDIKPKGTKIVRISPAKKGITVKWKKQSSQTDGYQIAYSTSSDFKKVQKVTVSGKNTISKKITGLKSKKKYYVKIRTYKKVKDGKKTVKIYSDWSTLKKVKIK